MSFEHDRLKEIFETLKRDLGEGFIATDIWATADGRPLIENHDYNKDPRAVILFNEATRLLYRALEKSEYPGLGNYYLVNLKNDQLVVVLTLDVCQQFILVDTNKIPMGLLMSVALPNLISSLVEIKLEERTAEPEAERQTSKPETAERLKKSELAETPSENETKKSRTDAEEKESPPKESALKELFKAFTKGVYYADKE